MNIESSVSITIKDSSNLFSKHITINCDDGFNILDQVTLRPEDDLFKDPKLDGIYNRIRLSSSPLTREETINIRKISKHRQDEMTALSASYTQLLDRITGLIREATNLKLRYAHKKNQIAKCTEMLSSIRLLPVELLGEIFRHCLPEAPHPDPQTAPLLLCRVSSSWREIAHRLPLLWNNIWIPYAPGNRRAIKDDSYKEIGQSISSWLDRCRGRPLSLSLNATNDFVLSKFLHLLPRISKDVHHLAFPAGSIARLSNSNFDFSNVESLHVTSWSLTSQELSIFTNMKKVRRLLLDVTNDASIRTLPCPWHQLTHLKTSGGLGLFSVQCWRELLRECSSLQEGDFVVRLMRPLTHNTSNPMTFRHLTHLTLDIFGTGNLPHLLSGFALPALTHLKLYGTWPDFEMGELRDMFGLRLQALVHITLWNVVMSVPDICDLLRSYPFLKTLRLNTHFDELDLQSFLTFLTLDRTQALPHNQRGAPAPRLEELHLMLQFEHFQNTGMPLIRQLLESRWKSEDNRVERSLVASFYLVPPWDTPWDGGELNQLIEIAKVTMQELERPDWRRCVQIRGVHPGFKLY